jgi:hypothetical protein
MYGCGYGVKCVYWMYDRGIDRGLVGAACLSVCTGYVLNWRGRSVCTYLVHWIRIYVVVGNHGVAN